MTEYHRLKKEKPNNYLVLNIFLTSNSYLETWTIEKHLEKIIQ